MIAKGLVIALLVATAARAETVVEAIARGDAAWMLRASDSGVDVARSAEARAAYEDAVRLDPSSLDARFRLLESLWFDGHFAQALRADQKKTHARMTDLAEETVAIAGPRLAEAHFWAAIAWGLWASSHGSGASGFKGVAAKIRDHATALIAADERFADGGGLRLLGRLHARAPRVPLFSGWIDRDEGLALLERAHAISTSEPRNALYLAEALIDRAPSRRDEALALLRDVASRTADPAHRLEQQETIDEARRVLEKEAP